MEALYGLEDDPYAYEELKENYQGTRRIRKSKFRVLYEIDEQKKSVFVSEVDPRLRIQRQNSQEKEVAARFLRGLLYRLFRSPSFILAPSIT